MHGSISCLAGRRRVRPNTTPYPNSFRHRQHSLSSLRGSHDTNDFRSSVALVPFADAHTDARLVDSHSHHSQKTPKQEVLTSHEKGTTVRRCFLSYLISGSVKNDVHEGRASLNEAVH